MTNQKSLSIQKFIDRFGEQIKYLFVSKDPNIDEYFEFCIINDKVFASGLNNHGQLGLGHQANIDGFEEVPELNGKNIVEILEGNECMFARTDGGLIYGWGGNNWGQLGRGTESMWGQYFKPALIEALKNQNVINMACGKSHNLALSSDGSVYGWGDNNSDQVGCDPAQLTIKTPLKIGFVGLEQQKVSYINCFMESSFAIATENEHVYFWGNNMWFKNIPEFESIEKFSEPTMIPGLKANKIVCNENSIYHIHNNNLYKNGSMKIDTNVQDIFITGDTILYMKQNEVYSLKINQLSKTTYRAFQEYLIRELNITQLTVKYAEIKHLFETKPERKSLGRSVSSLSVRTSSQKPSYDLGVKDYSPSKDQVTNVINRTSASFFESNQNNKEEKNLNKDKCKKFMKDIKNLVDPNNQTEFNYLLTKLNETQDKVTENDNLKIVTDLIEMKDNFQRRFENEYDVNMVYFAAINFALYMIPRYYEIDQTLKLFKAYIEFTLSYFLFNHHENLPMIKEYFIFDSQDYQNSKSMPKKLLKKLRYEYLYYQAIAIQDEIFTLDEEMDEDFQEYYDQYCYEEETLLKFPSKLKTLTTCEWLKQAVADIYETAIQVDQSTLMSPGDYLYQANEVINNEDKTTKQLKIIINTKDFI